MVSISGLHDLDPLDIDLELLAFMLSVEDWEVCALAEGVEQVPQSM